MSFKGICSLTRFLITAQHSEPTVRTGTSSSWLAGARDHLLPSLPHTTASSGRASSLVRGEKFFFMFPFSSHAVHTFSEGLLSSASITETAYPVRWERGSGTPTLVPGSSFLPCKYRPSLTHTRLRQYVLKLFLDSHSFFLKRYAI